MQDGSEDRPAGALPRGYARREHVEPRPVWVRLAGGVYPDAHNGADGQDAGFVGAHGNAPVPAGQHGRLNLAGEVIGWLHHWERSAPEGSWFGVVDFSVPLIDDFRPALKMSCVLVCADALRPRELQAPDGRAHQAP